MMLHRPGLTSLAVFLVSFSAGQFAAVGQDPPTDDISTTPGDSQQAERRQIFESERWRETNRILNEWLSVQTVYTDDEVANLKVELNARTARMSPRELEAFLEEMEGRLEVLMSPEAEDARQWLARLFAVARDPEQRVGRRRPDVMNMTASEIREELNWLEQHRESRQQAQATFDRTRAQRVQSARQVQATRSGAQQRSRDMRTRAAPTQFRSELAPPVHERPNFTDFDAVHRGPLRPYYNVGPWGHPIRWHPLRDEYWYW
jgi:hypothetical protein